MFFSSFLSGFKLVFSENGDARRQILGVEKCLEDTAITTFGY